ncbi:LysR family transcriptional regulator [Oceanimonas sp. MB9]|uniref:LysR family transcriptional regulator n=1 Tax=Oceanimonas sp. MB9 TaxID=2588453 RepID=UPI0013F67968|nr:LysR family transcriptional regulator [Oceanimonas sp. MB9]NHI01683.1 Glycine cleavage system transcriptional activator [Oceanimonas sp. MB9]
MRRPPPHNWLFVFKVIVESGSITEASEKLNVSQSAVSQQIKSLEDYLGKRLIIRGKKGIVLTDVGKHYYNVIRVSLDNISVATEKLFGFEQKDTITIKSNYSFVDVWLSRHISAFYHAHPNTSIEIYTMLWLSDFRNIGNEIEIRYGDGTWSDAKVHRLTNDSIFPVCSPKTKRNITKPEHILDYPLVSVMGNKTGWTEWLQEMGVHAGGKSASLYVESNLLAYKASISGDYISLGINSLVDHFLQDGSLVRLDDRELKTTEDFFLLEPAEQFISEKEKVFIDWIKSTYTQQ